jgi:hypothetical protein
MELSVGVQGSVKSGVPLQRPSATAWPVESFTQVAVLVFVPLLELKLQPVVERVFVPEPEQTAEALHALHEV